MIEETLIHTSEAANAYERDGRTIRLHRHERRTLTGRHVSLLAGGTGSYYHSLIDSVARLSVVCDAGQAQVASILVPQEAVRAAELLAMMSPPCGPIAEVAGAESRVVEELVLPWTVHGQSSYNACIKPFFSRMGDSAGPPPRAPPKRLYISRTLAGNRRLVNEAELIVALTNVGFTAVNLEVLSTKAQMQLFRGADVIVAPHGAGLANMVFARPRAIVLELLMNSYVNWCFRHLAALLGLRYDCVVGRTIGCWSELSPAVHGDAWVVSIPHVLAAVDQLLPHGNLELAERAKLK